MTRWHSSWEEEAEKHPEPTTQLVRPFWVWRAFAWSSDVAVAADVAEDLAADLAALWKQLPPHTCDTHCEGCFCRWAYCRDIVKDAEKVAARLRHLKGWKDHS